MVNAIEMPVVVGVDGSEHGRAALRWAAGWSRRTGAPLIAATSWQYPRTAALPTGPELAGPAEMDRAAEDDLRATVTDVLGADALDGGASSASTVVERGPASWALLEVASTSSAGMLVVGKRGLGPIEGRLLGSVSRRVAEMSPCPVVIVPAHGPVDLDPADDATVSGPVVVGVDGSPPAERAVEFATEAARAMGTSVLVVHGLAGLPAELAPSAVDRFVAQAHELVDRLAARVTDAGVPADTYVDVADPRPLLRDVADRRDAPLVVVGAAGDGPAAGMLVGSVVTHVTQQSERPVAVIR